MGELEQSLIEHGDAFELQYDDRWRRNVLNGVPENPCIICGQQVNNVKYRVRVFYAAYIVSENGARALIERDGDENGDHGCFPVGMGCIKRHPELKPFLIKQQKAPTL